MVLLNLGKYRIDIYHNGGIKRNFYINLPNKILASGKSFNICNSNSKGAGYSKAWKKACGQDKTCLRTGPGEWPKAWDCKYKANTVPSGRKMQQPLGCAKF